MKYSVKVNEVKKADGNIKGFATVVFGDSFKITNIAILQNKDNGQLFVSMPRYRSSERDEKNNPVYKDVCHPTTADFRTELHDAIIRSYENNRSGNREADNREQNTAAAPEFKVTVTPYERDGSNIKALARVSLDNSFQINNVTILESKGKLFVSMPSYRTKQLDEQGKAIYQDVCYPVTKEFRAKLYDTILAEYEIAKNKDNSKSEPRTEARTQTEQREWTPFR